MINQEGLLAKYDDKKGNYFLLDVRTPEEFSDGHIPGSINCPIDEMSQHLKEIPLDRHIVTICAHGVRSGMAESYLREQGYLADSLAGGLSVLEGPDCQGLIKLFPDFGYRIAESIFNGLFMLGFIVDQHFS
jgi:rhodanese-related sulfurtransferase